MTLRHPLEALVSLVRLLKCGRPREVLAHLPSPWLLYSDGACEPARTGFSGISVGAILFSPGGVAQFLRAGSAEIVHG